MEYTVNGLARLAGVSVRTLHWYDEIGLLRPARVTEAGYRMYGPDEVDALQSILFYRALGVPLKQIGALMAQGKRDEAEEVKKQVAASGARIDELSAREKEVEEELLKNMMVIPNIIDPSVPIGKDDSENVEIEKFGEPVVPDFLSQI